MVDEVSPTNRNRQDGLDMKDDARLGPRQGFRLYQVGIADVTGHHLGLALNGGGRDYAGFGSWTTRRPDRSYGSRSGIAAPPT